MSKIRFVLLAGGASVAFASGAWLQGCSSSSSGTTPPAQDSGVMMMEDSAASNDSGMAADTEVADSGTAPGDAAGDTGTCESPPSLFPETAPGVYCPFSGVNGGSAITCTAGQHCCETPVAANTPSTCVANGTPCPVAGSVDWECEEAIDCTTGDAGAVCCGTGTPTTATHCGITWPEWNSFTGTKCMPSCPSPGITVCEKPSDCTGDAGTCTASKASGNDFGFCGP
jgi:hypothetical protein